LEKGMWRDFLIGGTILFVGIVLLTYLSQR
jgi:hypothetical protein